MGFFNVLLFEIGSKNDLEEHNYRYYFVWQVKHNTSALARNNSSLVVSCTLWQVMHSTFPS